MRELLKAAKRRFYICSPFAEKRPRAISTYNTAGRREAIVSTCSPLLNRFMIKASTQYAVNLVGILVAYLGRSPIKLLFPVPLISAVRLVYQDLLFNTMPVCAFSPGTALFLGFSAFQGVERELTSSSVFVCCCGCCCQKRHPNLQSLKSMAIVERFNQRHHAFSSCDAS